MHFPLLQFLILLSVAFMLIMLAQKLKISYPIFLVVAGLAISYIPGIPSMSIDPEVIFLIFLPPLLYDAAWYTSWDDFIKWRRPISLLAFGLVIITSVGVAITTSYFIPGFTLALGFLLGGYRFSARCNCGNLHIKEHEDTKTNQYHFRRRKPSK